MTPAEIRFAADGMLQSLGTWLRLMGYDCITGPNQSGRALLEQAITEDRVFLTRNAHLSDNLPHAMLARGQIVYVMGERLPEQLREVVAKFSLETERFVFTRCVTCNEPLRRVERAEAVGHVPNDVGESETEFWQCAHCDKTFWRGSHVRNSAERLRRWLGASHVGFSD